MNPNGGVPSLANAFAGIYINNNPLVLKSVGDLQTMLEAVQAEPPVPLAALPRQQRFSGYWSLQNPDWPPLPGDIYGMNVWPLGNGNAILDDSQLDYSALQAEADRLAELEAAANSHRPKMRMMSTSLLNGYGNPVYLTNLVATNAGGMTVAFDIAGGTNLVPYDIMMATNLTTPMSSWTWLGFGYTSNRYTFTNQPSDTAFYRLAKPSKTMTVGIGADVFGRCIVPYGLTNALQVAAGYYHSLALKTDRTVAAWGGNFYGEGDVPTNLTGVAMIAAGQSFNVALLTNGNVTAWGDNSHGQTNVPSGLTNVVVISANFYHTLALTGNGQVVAWGLNPLLGSEAAMVPAGLSNVTAIAAGRIHNLAVSNGYVVAWGYNAFGCTTVPAGLSNVVDVAAGVTHSLALLKDGTVVAWGGNTYGQTNVPAGLSNVVAIAAGGDPNYNNSYSLALKADGTVVVWGTGSPNAPVGGLNQVIAIAAGADHALAIRTGPPTPVISLEPVTPYLLPGGNVSFTTRGAGLYGVAYQWQTNGVNLPGATNATLNITNVQPNLTNFTYRCVVTNELGALASSNVIAGVVTPPVFAFISPATNVFVNYADQVLLQANATAPGANSGFPITFSWLANGVLLPFSTTRSNSFQFNGFNGGSYTLIASNAAGTNSVTWTVALSPSVTNAINVTNDLLLIYNSTSSNSTALKDYYLTHRPMVGGANVLGLSCGTNEVIAFVDYSNQIAAPILAWLTNNPTKRPQYVIIFYDMPTRTSPYPDGYGSIAYNMRSYLPGWQPYVNNLNAGTLADCKAYVDKIASFGSNYSPGQLIISAGGYGNTNYYFDDTAFPGFSGFGLAAENGDIANGVSSNSVIYTNVVPDCGSMSCHITSGVNVAGYVCSGVPSSLGGDYALDGKVQWSGQSGWWIIETVESFNGVRGSTHGNFVKWLSSNAFGGTNYSNTPVGAVTHVDEPGPLGIEDSSVYFGLWASGKNFAICAWSSRSTPFFQAVGDPFVIR